MPRKLHLLTEPITLAERAAKKQEREAWKALEDRTAVLEAALNIIASGMRGDRVLVDWEINEAGNA